jgi:hypothetical protein
VDPVDFEVEEVAVAEAVEAFEAASAVEEAVVAPEAASAIAEVVAASEAVSAVAEVAEDFEVEEVAVAEAVVASEAASADLNEEKATVFAENHVEEGEAAALHAVAMTETHIAATITGMRADECSLNLRFSSDLHLTDFLSIPTPFSKSTRLKRTIHPRQHLRLSPKTCPSS